MTVRFYLHSFVNQKGQQAIYVEVRHAPTGLILRQSTALKCKESDWQASKQRVRLKLATAPVTNGKLNKLERKISEAPEPALRSTEALKEYLASTDEEGTPLPSPEDVAAAGPVTLVQLASDWAHHYRAKYSHNHLRKMKPLADHWEAFRPGTKIEELVPPLGQHENRLVEQWIAYLLHDAPQPDGRTGMESNSAGNYIRRLRLLLKFAGLRYDWLSDELTYEVEIEPLLFEEVEQLYEAALPSERLRQVRDCFVFNCLTGPRYSNLSTIKPEDVEEQAGGVLLLGYHQYKGRDKRKVRVALDPLAQEIWHRYEGRLPVPSNQEMNREIKVAAKLAGLIRPVLQVRQQGVKRHERRGPLCEFITCHTARHTFATMLLDGGADLGVAQNGLGHTNIQNTRRYAKTREKQRHVATLSAFENLRAASHSDSDSVRK